MADLTLCPGCGAALPTEPGAPAPAHAYLGASPECWRRWTDSLVSMSSAGNGRLATDAYAAQHPGIDGRRQRQSVAVHLIALCHALEMGIGNPRLTQLTRRALEGRPDWPWLEPPHGYSLTFHDLPQPPDSTDVRRWAQAVWAGWAAQHAIVRGWAERLLKT